MVSSTIVFFIEAPCVTIEFPTLTSVLQHDRHHRRSSGNTASDLRQIDGKCEVKLRACNSLLIIEVELQNHFCELTCEFILLAYGKK